MINAVEEALRDLPEAPVMFERASSLVSEWKEANGKPLLSPEVSRDLAGRIMLALIEAQQEVALHADGT
jgi:hypothetical protein